MRRVVLLVVLLGLGIYLIGARSYGSDATVAAVEEPVRVLEGAPAAALETPEERLASRTPQASSVIAANPVIGADRSEERRVGKECRL